MAETECPTQRSRYRLRGDVLKRLMKARGASSVTDQVQLLGLSRATFHRLRAGGNPSLESAMQVANRLDVPLEALFEEVGADQ